MKRRPLPVYDHPLTCPSCFSRNDMAASPTGTGAPAEGSAMLCFTCGEFMIVTGLNAHGARQPTPDEVGELASDPMAREMQRRWKQVMR